MRLTIAAGALALLACAAPASAQRVDTRRIDVRPVYIKDRGTIGGYTCHFSAARDLELVHYSERLVSFATLEEPAQESRPGDQLILRYRFTPRENAPSGVESSPGSFLLKLGDGPLASGAVAARLLVDGRDSGMTLAVREGPGPPPDWASASGNTLLYREPRYYMVSPSAAPAMFDMLSASREAELQLLDQAGATLYRWRWDVHSLSGIRELLSLVAWDCQTPDPDS